VASHTPAEPGSEAATAQHKAIRLLARALLDIRSIVRPSPSAPGKQSRDDGGRYKDNERLHDRIRPLQDTQIFEASRQVRRASGNHGSMRTDRLDGRCGSQDASGAGDRVPGLITTNPGSVVDDHQRRRARTWYLGIGPGDTRSSCLINPGERQAITVTRGHPDARLSGSAGTPMARRRIRNRRSASFAAPIVTSTARSTPQTSTSRRSRHSDQTGGRDCPTGGFMVTGGSATICAELRTGRSGCSLHSFPG
jgi:hypothetical protein